MMESSRKITSGECDSASLDLALGVRRNNHNPANKKKRQVA
jgi:hypothetical protein